MITVLTADSSRVVRAVLEHHLERYDCAAVEATNADEAIAGAHEHHPALMIVDAAVHAIATRRENDAYDSAPVVLLTTEGPGSDRFGGDPQVLATLRKPFDQSSFDRAVRSVLRSTRTADTPAARAQLGAAR